MYHFNAQTIFALAGGNAALRRMLKEDTGIALTEYTVGMWKSRDRIAGNWVAQCVMSLLARDMNLTIDDLVIKEELNAKPKPKPYWPGPPPGHPDYPF